MTAVGGNISAVYIVRAFHERAKALKELTKETTEMITANSKDHPHLMHILTDSKLTDEQMTMLTTELVGAMNNLDKENGQNYLNKLAHFLDTLGPQKGIESDKEEKKGKDKRKDKKKRIKGEKIIRVEIWTNK
jgi:hypothetical protein